MSEARAALEAAIEEHPDDPRVYSVYADWLQEQGDPRGELIALQQAAELDPSLADQARACFEQQIDRLGSYTTCEFTWRYGFVQRATLGLSEAQSATFIEKLLDHPSGRFIVDISLWPSGSSPEAMGPAIDVLVKRARPAQRSLSVVARTTTLQAISRLFGPAFPRLERLAILGALHADELLPLLCESPMLRQLRVLDLSGGALTDRGLEHLARNQAALANLEVLDLRLNALTQAGTHIASRLAKRVHTTGQRKPDKRSRQTR